MILTITFLFIVLAVVLMIAYMIYNDYKVQQDIDQKALIAKKKQIISEADELLLNVTQIPYSTKLIILLQERVLDALKQINAVTPNNMSIVQRINGLSEQIRNLRAQTPQEPNFTPPNDTNTSLKMLKTLRRIHKIIRIEFNRGRLSQADLISENKRLELMINKIQFNNLMSHVYELQTEKQYGTLKELCTGAIQSIKRMNTEDSWILSVNEELKKIVTDIDNQLSKKRNEENKKAQSDDEKEIDALFMPKKKW